MTSGMTRLPTRRALVLCVLGGAPLAFTQSPPVALALAAVIYVVLAAVLAIDLRLIARVTVSAEAPKRVSRLQPFSVRYTVHNPSPRALAIALEETMPEQIQPATLHLTT